MHKLFNLFLFVYVGWGDYPYNEYVQNESNGNFYTRISFSK
jgi:hypothetical protein